jgi:hypothetical protein
LRPNRRECLTLWQERTSRKSSKNGGDRDTGVYMREGTTSRVMAADRPFGEFYDFYSVSSKYLDKPSHYTCQREEYIRTGVCLCIMWCIYVYVIMYVFVCVYMYVFVCVCMYVYTQKRVLEMGRYSCNKWYQNFLNISIISIIQM